MEVPRESNERGRTATEEEGRSQWSWHGYYHDRPCCPGNLDPTCFSFEITFTPKLPELCYKGKILICKSTQKVEARDCGEIKMISDCNFFLLLKEVPTPNFMTNSVSTTLSSLLGRYLMASWRARVNHCANTQWESLNYFYQAGKIHMWRCNPRHLNRIFFLKP